MYIVLLAALSLLHLQISQYRHCQYVKQTASQLLSPSRVQIVYTSSRSLIWLATELKNRMSLTIIPGSEALFFTYPFPVRTGEATLMVNDTINVQVVEDTCFQCSDPNDANAINTAVCVTITCEFQALVLHFTHSV